MKKILLSVAVAGGGLLLLSGCFSTPTPSDASGPSSSSVAPSQQTVQAETPVPNTGTPIASRAPNGPVETPPISTPSKPESPAAETPTPVAAPSPKETMTAKPAETVAPSTSPEDLQSEGGSGKGGTSVTVGQIKEKYSDQLKDLQDIYTKQLQTLYDQALGAKRSGKAINDILNSYSQQGVSLEEDAQAKVNQLLLQMKNELTADQLPSDSVDELRADYYAEMGKTKEAFAAKAKADFGM